MSECENCGATGAHLRKCPHAEDCTLQICDRCYKRVVANALDLSDGSVS